MATETAPTLAPDAKPKPRPKKERDLFLDFLKFLCCILVVMAHVGDWWSGDLYGTSVTNPLLQNSYLYLMGAKIGIFTNYVILSFFTFTTGYWFMNGFKRMQRFTGKGIDAELCIKQLGKNASAYWPFILYGTLFSFVCIHAQFPSLWINKPINLFLDFLNGIPHFLGIWSIFGNPGEFAWGDVTGQALADMTNNFTDATAYILSYNSTLWYMTALVMFAPMWFAIFAKSEAIGAFVWAPINYVAHAVWYSQADYYGFAAVAQFGISGEYLRLCGPWSTGVWAWYLTDWLKKKEFTPKQEKMLNWVFLGGLAWWVGSLCFPGHGVLYFDLPIAMTICPLLSGKCSVAKVFNNILKKVPGIKHMNTLSMGLFIHHTPVIIWLLNAQYLEQIPWFDAMTINMKFLFVLGICAALTIPYAIIDKLFLGKARNLVVWAFDLKAPIVLPGAEQKAPAKA